MIVQELMTKNVKVIDSSATLMEAAEIMRDEDIGALPVADAGRPIGMVTDRDIVVRAIAEAKDPAQTRVRDVITPRLTTIFADRDVREAADLMAKDQVRRLLVVDHQQTPVGILSLGDIVRGDTASDASADALQGVSAPEHNARLATEQEAVRRFGARGLSSLGIFVGQKLRVTNARAVGKLAVAVSAAGKSSVRIVQGESTTHRALRCGCFEPSDHSSFVDAHPALPTADDRAAIPRRWPIGPERMPTRPHRSVQANWVCVRNLSVRARITFAAR